MEEHALPVRTWLVPQPCRAVLGRSQLCLEDTAVVDGAVDGLYATLCLLLRLERDVDTKGLVLAVGAFPVADGDLLDVAILAEEFGLSERLEKLVFAYAVRQPRDVHQVLLYDADANEVLSVLLLGLAFLCFLLPLLLCPLLLVLLDVGLELGDPIDRVSPRRSRLGDHGWTYSSCVTTFHCIVFSS